MKNISKDTKIKNSKDINLRPDHKDLSNHLDTKAYFRQLKLRLRIGFLIAFVVPFVALSVYFHFQFDTLPVHYGELSAKFKMGQRCIY